MTWVPAEDSDVHSSPPSGNVNEIAPQTPDPSEGAEGESPEYQLLVIAVAKATLLIK